MRGYDAIPKSNAKQWKVHLLNRVAMAATFHYACVGMQVLLTT